MTKERRKLPFVFWLPVALAVGLALGASPSSKSPLPALTAAWAQVEENPPPQRDRLPSGVSSWKLDETSGTTALDSWGSNHGEHTSGVAVGTPGLVSTGHSADYDGARGWTVINSSASLNVTSAITLEAWARPDTLPSSSASTRTILRKDGQYLLRLLSNGAVVFRLWIGGAAREVVTSAGTIAPGGIYHLVATYDGASQTIYVNGAAIVTRAQTGTISTTANPLIIGASSSGGIYDLFDGRLDNVTLYSSAVTASWVADRYNQGLCRPAFGGFDVGSWPPGCWRPYGETSPFNQSLPPNPRLDPNSAQIITDMRSAAWNGGGFSDQVAGAGVSECTSTYYKDYQHPVYYSRPTDPVFTITRADGGYDSELYSDGLNTIRIPDAARPACGSDAHLTVIDQSAGWEYDFWQVQRKDAGGGVLAVRGAGRTRIDGLGLDAPDVPGDANAGRWGLMGGIIRAQEMRNWEINHALFMVVKCDNTGLVYPASGHGAPCRDANGNPNHTGPPMGARIQLDMSDEEINALNVPAWRKTVLRALARYGAFVGDTGGSPWDLQFESGRSYTSFGYEDEMVIFAQQVGIPSYNGVYIFDLNTGVDWSRLRIVDPCVTRGDCP
jgi:hypothetical protein